MIAPQSDVCQARYPLACLLVSIKACLKLAPSFTLLSCCVSDNCAAWAQVWMKTLVQLHPMSSSLDEDPCAVASESAAWWSFGVHGTGTAGPCLVWHHSSLHWVDTPISVLQKKVNTIYYHPHEPLLWLLSRPSKATLFLPASTCP